MKAAAVNVTLPHRRRTTVLNSRRDSDPSRRDAMEGPPFASLLEETELAGWSSHRTCLGGGFHDWQLLEDGRVLAAVGQATATLPTDRLTLALAARAAQAAIRAHALHTDDAGRLLQFAARSLDCGGEGIQLSLAVALVDGVGGEVNLAIAGDSFVWRVRASRWDQLPTDLPPLGAESSCPYAAEEFALSLRERLVLVADNPACRSARFASSVALRFGKLDAESHRRMTAGDALSIVQSTWERDATGNSRAAANIIAIRRR
jgi:hypothetical protein